MNYSQWLSSLIDPRAWLRPRNIRFWLLLGLALYALLGFLVLPGIARSQIEQQLTRLLARPVAVEAVRINPFALTAEVTGFAVDEADGTAVAGVQTLFANLQLSSIFRQALVLRELRLDEPYLNVIRQGPDDLNLARLWADVAPASQDTAVTPEAAGLPRIVIQQLVLRDGAIDIADYAPATPFKTRVGPIDIQADALSTLPDAAGRQRLTIGAEGDTEIILEGTVALTPLALDGRLRLEGPLLPLVSRYLQDQLLFSIDEGAVAVDLRYQIANGPDDTLSADIRELRLALSNVNASSEPDGGSLLRLPNLQIDGGYLRWPARRAGAAQLRLEEPAVNIIRRADGAVNLTRLISQESPAAPAQPEAQPESETEAQTDSEPEPEPTAQPVSGARTWDLRLDALRVDGVSVRFVDESLEQAGELVVAGQLSARDLSNEPEARIPWDAAINPGAGGSVRAEGELMFSPGLDLKATIAIDQLPLAMAQPWVAQMAQLEVVDGLFSGEVQLGISPQLSITGALTIAELELSDRIRSESLLAWQSMALNDLEFVGGDSPALVVGAIQLQQPYGRVRIFEDGSTNLSDLARPQDSDAESAAGPAVTIGRVRIVDARMDFSDRSLPLPFSTTITGLSGNVSTLSNRSREPAVVELEGAVDEYGFARVEGNLLLSDLTAGTDVRVQFRNVALPDLSPYTIKFAGRRMAEGKLDLNLEYRIKNGALDASNKVVIKQLRLGERVDQPGAMSLPLGLAVALLKDPSGNINIDLPVSGNVNDPQFSYGGVIARAFGGLITGLVSSPFRLLAGLVGRKDERFDTIEFAAGAADLKPPEREKLAQLATALTQRPALKLEIPGVVDPRADRAALAEARIDGRIAEGTGAAAASSRREVIESLYQDAFPQVSLAARQQAFQSAATPDDDTSETELDEPAYLADLRNELIQQETISADDLAALARARADAVRSALGDADLAPRLDSAATVETKADEGGWIPLKLKLRD